MVGAKSFFDFIGEVDQERFLVCFRFSSKDRLQPPPFCSVVIPLHLSLEISDGEGLR